MLGFDLVFGGVLAVADGDGVDDESLPRLLDGPSPQLLGCEDLRRFRAGTACRFLRNLVPCAVSDVP